MKREEFIFCPLGGSGEIGMNMNLFAYGNPENRKWIVVDIGVTFADDSVPGIDLIYPDPGYIVDKKTKKNCWKKYYRSFTFGFLFGLLRLN